MAEKNRPATVEVRLLGKRPQRVSTPDGTSVQREPGEVFQIDRAVYEADLEPDRGMGRPTRGRTFALVSEERAVEQKRERVAQATQDRIKAVREGVQQSIAALEQSRAQAKVQEAENARVIAETLTKPLDRPGARRVG